MKYTAAAVRSSGGLSGGRRYALWRYLPRAWARMTRRDLFDGAVEGAAAVERSPTLAQVVLPVLEQFQDVSTGQSLRVGTPNPQRSHRHAQDHGQDDEPMLHGRICRRIATNDALPAHIITTMRWPRAGMMMRQGRLAVHFSLGSLFGYCEHFAA